MKCESYELESELFTDICEKTWIRFEEAGKTFIVGCVYYPPQANRVGILVEYLTEIIDERYNRHPMCAIILGGDFDCFEENPTATNVDLIDTFCKKRWAFGENIHERVC